MEIKRGFNRIPGLKTRDTLKLARYLVEPTDVETVAYDEYKEIKVMKAKERLDEVLEPYELITREDEEQLQKSVVEKLGPYTSSVSELLQSLEKSPGIVDALAVSEMTKVLNFELTTKEKDFCVLFMYKSSKDIQRLPYQLLLNIIEENVRKVTVTDPQLEDEQNSEKGPENDRAAAEPSQGEELAEYGEDFEKPFEEKKRLQTTQPREEKQKEDERDFLQDLPGEGDQEIPERAAAEARMSGRSDEQERARDFAQDRKIPHEEKGDHDEDRYKDEDEGENEGEYDYEEKGQEQNEGENHENEDEDKDKNQESENEHQKTEHANENENEAQENEKEEEEEEEEKEEGSKKDKMMVVKFMQELGNEMQKQNQTISTLYRKVITRKRVREKEIEVISMADFVAGLEKLKLPRMSESTYQAIVNVLATDEEDIAVHDLSQVLQKFNPNYLRSLLKPQYKALDDLSMALLLRLTEYIVNEHTNMYDLFDKAIYTQTFRHPHNEGNAESEIDLITSENFFDILYRINVKSNPLPHDNLQDFLAVAPQHHNKLAVDKLIAAITDFAQDNALRQLASCCCSNLASRGPPLYELLRHKTV